MTVIKPGQLKAYAGAILDRGIHTPEYVDRGGAVLVIKEARLM
jgi:hypothetical protein